MHSQVRRIGATPTVALMTSNPRCRVATYLVLTFAFSSIYYVLCHRHGMKQMYIFGLMWCPAIAALLTALLTKRPFRDFGWNLGNARYLLAGWAIPMGYSWPAYVVVWATGLGGFPNQHTVNMIRELLHMPATPTWITLVAYYVLGSVLAVGIGCVFAAGEEIGWRGFLVPELAKFNSFTHTALISGVVWSLWHTPLIIWSDYNSKTSSWYAITCFSAITISMGFVFAWIRLRSGSVWPAVLLHASHNAIIQGYLDPLTVNRAHTNYYIGEFGCAMLPLTFLSAWIAWRRRALVKATGSTEVIALAVNA